MAKIVIDARRIRSSTGRYIHELIKQLEKQDSEHDYHIVVHTNDADTWQPTKDNFQLHVVPYDHYTFGEQLGFAVFLYRLKPDLVHFSMPQQPLLYFGKRITTVHDLTLVFYKNLDKNKLIYWIEQRVFILLLKNVVRRSKFTITPTKFVRDQLRNYVKTKPEKIIHTYEAVDHFQKQQPEAVHSLGKSQFILYLGNAYPYKNVQALIDAYVQAQKKFPKLKLALAGKIDFFYQWHIDYVAEQKINGVHFLDFVSDEQAAWLYQNAQLFVFPSLSEGFGLPGLEAMVYGCPVIAANNTTLPEIYGSAAYYFDPTKTKDISNAIITCLSDKTKQEQMRQKSLQQWKKFSWHTTAKQTLQLYNSAIGNRET